MVDQSNKRVTPRNHIWKFIGPAVILILLVTGTYLGLHFGSQWISSDKGSHHAAPILERGQILPDFVLQRLEGGEVSLSHLRHKVMLINFWATWCQGCLIEMPSLVRLRDEFKKEGFEILAISVDENPEQVVPSMATRLKMNFPIFVDKDQKISDALDIHAIPLTILINQKREILYVQIGDRNWDSKEVHTQVKKWLQ